MDHISKPNLVKSKSSNSAMTTKSENRNRKKTKSNVEFQPMLLKKRGVYVEKKNTKTQIIDADETNVRMKKLDFTSRSRPDKKRYLTSVFTVLSKSTAGTQCSDLPNTTLEDQKKEKSKGKKKMKEGAQNEDGTKRKYKSKYLQAAASRDVQHVRILQPTKEVIDTPSNYSSSEVYRWSQLRLPPLVKKQSTEVSVNAQEKSNLNKVHESIVKEVLEGKKLKENKEDKALNLVTDVIDKDKKIYNLFVDLLETTISVCNMKGKFNDRSPSNASNSKTALEIDEVVAKKLAINDIPNTIDDEPQKSNPTAVPYRNDEWSDRNFLNCFGTESSFMCSTGSTTPPKTSVKRKRTLNHFTRSYELAAPRNRKALAKKKRSSRKSKKSDLLNILKEELRMDEYAYIEPKNLYQALKIIARNKRKYRKAIHFEDSYAMTKTEVDFGDHECTLARRALIPFDRDQSEPYEKTKKNKNTNSNDFKYSYSKQLELNRNFKRERNKYKSSKNNVSNHSLQVYEYDNDTHRIDKTLEKVNDQIRLRYNSPLRTGDETSKSDLYLKSVDSASSSYI